MGTALEFKNNTLPPRIEFLRLLQEASASYDPIEKLIALDRELIKFEQKYSISSLEFYQRFQSGEMGDAMDFIRWAGRYEMYVRLKGMISASLDVVVAEAHPVLV